MKSSLFPDFRPLDVAVKCGRAAVTGTLCALLAGQPIVAESSVKKPAAARKPVEIQGRE